MTFKSLLIATSVFLGIAFAAPAFAGDVQVAVAANFTDTAKDIAAAFEKKTGNHVVMSFGPSGGFFSQIEQGAPFEVFLSADADLRWAWAAAWFGPTMAATSCRISVSAVAKVPTLLPSRNTVTRCDTRKTSFSR